jgi:hypothetical protein
MTMLAGTAGDVAMELPLACHSTPPQPFSAGLECNARHGRF